MAKLSMDELVEMYNEVLNFDNNDECIKIYVYKNKEDLIKKYVEKNILKMKIDEPITNESYDEKFKGYLKELRMLLKTFNDKEVIIVGVFGFDYEFIDVERDCINLYNLSELDLLIEDISNFYK